MWIESAIANFKPKSIEQCFNNGESGVSTYLGNNELKENLVFDIMNELQTKQLGTTSIAHKPVALAEFTLKKNKNQRQCILEGSTMSFFHFPPLCPSKRFSLWTKGNSCVQNNIQIIFAYYGVCLVTLWFSSSFYCQLRFCSHMEAIVK